MRRWTERLVHAPTVGTGRPTLALDRVLDEAVPVPRAAREDLVARPDAPRPWRNALCHGAWRSVAEDGCGCLEHVCRYDGLPAGFERNVDVERLSEICDRTVDIPIRVAEGACVAGPVHTRMGGAGYVLATVVPRMVAPRSASPELQSRALSGTCSIQARDSQLRLTRGSPRAHRYRRGPSLVFPHAHPPRRRLTHLPQPAMPAGG